MRELELLVFAYDRSEQIGNALYERITVVVAHFNRIWLVANDSVLGLLARWVL